MPVLDRGSAPFRAVAPDLRQSPFVDRKVFLLHRSPALHLGIENHVGVTVDNCDNCANWRVIIRVRASLADLALLG